MRLLHFRRTDDGSSSTLSLTADLKSSDLPPYAILSHTWGPDDSELTFEDVSSGLETSYRKAGYEKVLFCGERARKDGLDHFWVDSCCIDKSNSAELAEAIISMFAWYRNSEKCYVYLSDLTLEGDGTDQTAIAWEKSFKSCKWFTRGWTLQEMLAPSVVEFYSKDGTPVGDKRSLGALIGEVTGLPWSALQGADLSSFGVAERLSWAAKRNTTREEDRAYCLLGIFNVFIPPMYGEGTNAFVRLEEEIGKRDRNSTYNTRRAKDVDDSSKSASILESLPVARQAAFDSISKQDDPLCLSGTRVGILKRMREWVYGEEQSRVFWLNGMAGTGKSTISRTLAREFNERGHLAASFFFARNEGEVSHAGLFFTTIAKQLSRSCPSMRQPLVDALEIESDLSNKTRYDQWAKMILGPLNQMPVSVFNTPQVLVILIDALDECNNDNDIKGIIKLMSEAKDITSVKLRIIVTGRPETAIRLAFKQIQHTDLLLHDERREVVDADISLFLRDQFDKITITQDWLPEGWPGVDVISRLVQLADGLFIFAATICRFIIEDDDRGVESSLDLFLQSTTRRPTSSPDIDISETKNSLAELDKLYSQVLGKSSQQLNPLIDTLSLIAALHEPLTAGALSQLLVMRLDDIHRRLNKLHSVVFIPARDHGSIRLFHASFRDFLFEKNRCFVSTVENDRENSKPLAIDVKDVHKKLTSLCLRLMSHGGRLHRDVCNVGQPGIRRHELSSEIVSNSIPEDLTYACRYWVHHLESSGVNIQDGDEVHTFLKTRWLYWIEALSWLGWTSRSSELMNTLQGLSDQNTAAGRFINNAKRFFLSNRYITDEAPLQLYCSALMFAPSECLVRENFQKDVLVHLAINPKVPEHWESELFKLEGHDCEVSSVCVSADGSLVASGSEHGIVRIWNLDTGKSLQHLKGLSSRVDILAFSPDGRHIAAGIAGGYVMVWTTWSGEMIRYPAHPLYQEHSDSYDPIFTSYNSDVCGLAFLSQEYSVNGLAYSPDGKYIASASGTGAVRIWGTDGKLANKLDGQKGCIVGISYTPDGQYIISSSTDESLQVWNARTGEPEVSLPLPDFPVKGMAFTDEGELIIAGWYDEISLVVPEGLEELYCVLHASRQAEAKQFSGHCSRITCVAFSRDGRQIAAGSTDGTIRVWDFETGADTGFFDEHDSSITSLAFAPNGRLLVSASKDFTVRVWDSTARRLSKSLRTKQDGVTEIKMSPEGRNVATVSASELKIWDIESGEEKLQLSASVHPFAINISPDGQLVAAASHSESAVSIWDMETSQAIWRFERSKIIFTVVAFSPDGQLIAAGCHDGELQIWQIHTHEPLLRIKENDEYLTKVLFSPNGGFVVLQGEDHTLDVWNVAERKRELLLQHGEHHQGVCRHAVAFSPNGELIGEGSVGIIIIWDIATKAPVQSFGDSWDDYCVIAFSSDNGMLAAYSSLDDAVSIWNVHFGQKVKVIRDQRALESMSFSMDNSHLYTNIGQIGLLSTTGLSSLSVKQKPTIRLVGRWVRHNDRDVLWLPYEYQGNRSVCHDDTLVLLQLNNELTFIRFTTETKFPASIGLR